MVPKIISPDEIAAMIVMFGTPINPAIYPDAARPVQLDTFKITS